MDNEKLRLRLEVDSVVHPELHAVLSKIKSPKLRADRLRVLAEKAILMDAGFNNAIVKSKETLHAALEKPSPTELKNGARPAIKIRRDFASKKDD